MEWKVNNSETKMDFYHFYFSIFVFSPFLQRKP